MGACSLADDHPREAQPILKKRHALAKDADYLFLGGCGLRQNGKKDLEFKSYQRA